MDHLAAEEAKMLRPTCLVEMQEQIPAVAAVAVHITILIIEVVMAVQVL